MGQPVWKVISATDYSRILRDTTGEYPEEIEIAEDLENGRFLLYRVVLDRLKEVDGYLVPIGYDASWPHPVADYDEWFAKDLKSVASSIGSDHRELRRALGSKAARMRAWAYEAIGGYHGWDNFDSDPLRLTEEELNERWGSDSNTGLSGRRKSLTYGVLPSFDEFDEAFDAVVGDNKPYSIRLGRTDSDAAEGTSISDGDYTAQELYEGVRELVKKYESEENDDAGSLASSILETLGFEWI